MLGVKSLPLPFFCAKSFRESTNITHQETAMDMSHNIIKRGSNSFLETISKLVTLPSALIGKVGSYLKQNDYASLSSTNTSIYLGCNNPNALRVLNLESIIDYSYIKLAKYSGLKHLRLKVSKFSELLLPTKTMILPNLSKLELCGQEISNDLDMKPLLNQKVIDFGKITFLQLHRFENKKNEFPLDSFQRLMLLFPSIELLDLDLTLLNLTNYGQFDAKRWFPKLIGFRNWNHGNHLLVNQIIADFGHVLQYLCSIQRSNIVIPSNIKFPELQELYIAEINVNFMNSILDKTTTLERVKRQGLREVMTNKTEWNKLTVDLFTTQNSLSHLMFVERSNFELVDSIGDVLQYGLYAISKQNRRVRVKIIYGSNIEFNISRIDVSKIFIQADSIRNQLSRSFGKNNYVFTFHHKPNWEGDKDEATRMTHTLKARYSEDLLLHTEIFKDSMILTIYGRQCVINGWNSTWVLPQLE